MASEYSKQIADNVPPIRIPTEAEIAWAAGIYEGEGCVAGTKGRTIAVVSQKDPELLYRMRELFGGGITMVRMGTPKYCHTWKLYGDVARSFFVSIYPWLTTRRKGQIEQGGHLRFTGAVCYREMKISAERKARREGMTNSQKMVESQIAYRNKNREKVMAYQREYAQKKRNIVKDTASHVIQ